LERAWLKLGNIAKAFLQGTNKFESAEADLRGVVDEFNYTLSHFGHGVGLRTFQVVEGMR
jgi:hypothetical protein